MTFVIRKHIGRAHSVYKADTIAFIHDDRSSPDYPQGMAHFCHEYSLETGHINVGRGYSVRQACEAYGIDPDELIARRAAAARARWAAAGPIVFDKHGRLISNH
jgi:hypothetical protein